MKHCVICGKEFEPLNPRRLTCSKECRAENERRKARERYHNKPWMKWSESQEVKLEDKVAKAHEQGLTYGQYMAREQAKEVKVERETKRNQRYNIF